MPAVSERQRRFMGADLARARVGKRTRTGMTEEQLRDFAKKKGPAKRPGHAVIEARAMARSRRGYASSAHRRSSARRSAMKGYAR